MGEHDVIVVGQRRDRRLGEPDAEVSVRCRTCIDNTGDFMLYRILWEGQVLEASTFASIIATHVAAGAFSNGEPHG